MNHLPSRRRLEPLHSGTQVRVWRGLYWHHAIYIGDGILIEFGRGIFGGSVDYVRWEHFARHDHVERVNHHDYLPLWEVVKRAESQFDRTGFNVVTANCEHFATWCATGRWESEQFQVVVRGTASAAAAVIVLAAVATLIEHKIPAIA